MVSSWRSQAIAISKSCGENVFNDQLEREEGYAGFLS